MFIQFEDEQVVISVDCNHDGSLEITVRSSMDSASFWDRWNEYAEKNNYLHGNAFFADGEIIERTKKMTWDNIFLAEETKRLVKTHVCNFIENRDRLKLCGVKARRGLILSGVPGTGKSLLGKVLADTLDISFMWVLPRHIKNSESFAAIMSVARLTAPTVLFFEDIDLYAEDRNTAGWGGLGELMNQLDGCRENTDIITIASTNRLEVVEKALQNRPGRFDRIVEVGHMDEICCRKFLAKLLSDASICSEDFEYAVAQLNECTGAQIEEFSNTLYILAVERNPTRGPGSQAGGPVVLDRIIIDLALGELKFEKKRRLGFNVA